jgi:enoyl-CoA hydratase/carnithine racemase
MPDAIIEREGRTLIITMNRPKRYNALSGQMLIRMHDAMV